MGEEEAKKNIWRRKPFLCRDSRKLPELQINEQPQYVPTTLNRRDFNKDSTSLKAPSHCDAGLLLTLPDDTHSARYSYTPSNAASKSASQHLVQVIGL